MWQAGCRAKPPGRLHVWAVVARLARRRGRRTGALRRRWAGALGRHGGRRAGSHVWRRCRSSCKRRNRERDDGGDCSQRACQQLQQSFRHLDLRLQLSSGAGLTSSKLASTPQNGFTACSEFDERTERDPHQKHSHEDRLERGSLQSSAGPSNLNRGYIDPHATAAGIVRRFPWSRRQARGRGPSA
jgi:hypothetical protein